MLALKHIRKAFAGKTVADNISLSVADGKLLAVLGPSGCGKSTLLNIAAGLVAADSGEVWIGGENRSRMPPERRRVALMFQDYALLPHLNVWQNVAFGLKMQGVDKHEARRRAEAALAEVGLAAELGRRIDALSGGEQQRVQLARSLAQLWGEEGPQGWLFLDEPTSALDLFYQQHLLRLLKKLSRAGGLHVCIVLHDLNLAALWADTILLLHQGKLVAEGTPHDVIQPSVIHRWYGADISMSQHPQAAVPQVYLTP